MKRLISFLFLLVCSLVSLAQVPQVQPTQMEPHWGFIRKSPCGNGDGDNCGSNPPSYHLTPAMCGLAISTSAARNADGSNSTDGVRFTLPTSAEFTTAGYTGAGAQMSSGYTNRSGQCEISFVMGAPGPQNFLRIGMDGVAGTDKFTSFAQGAYDLSYGDIVIPYASGAVVTTIWNGTSWLVRSSSPSIAERLGLGQQAAHGQGRLFQVTADPSWWTSSTLVGSLAFCPYHGRGTDMNGNGGFQLSLIPANCAFLAQNTSGTSVDYIMAYNVVSTNITAIAAGSAYSSGTAPNGATYSAGNYVRITVSSLVNFNTGNTIEVHNVRTNNGTNIDGKWIGNKIDASTIELHEKIDEGNGRSGGQEVAIGPPSSFVSGDALVATVTGLNYMTLATNGSASTVTNPTNGAEIDKQNLNRTFVGVAKRTNGTGYQDTATNRHVASVFNPVQKKCLTTTASDRTATSTTFAKVNVDMDCSFVYTDATPKTVNAAMGDTGRRVTVVASISAGNNTAGDGCEYAIGFDGTTAESEVTGFVNPSGVSGGRQNVTITATKYGLSETGTHTVSLLVRAVTGGTCTTYSASSYLSVLIWQ